MNKEKFFINHIADSSIIGDDAAFIDGFTYSVDAFFENVHFKKEWMSYEQIGNKAMLINISDCIAMNAIPLYALLSVAMPAQMSETDILNLQKGFKKAAKKYGIKIIGGDTIENCKLDISITIIGKSSAPVYRKGLQKGDLIAYTGELGSVKKDLGILLSGGKIPKNSKFFSPRLRESFMKDAAPYLSCALDISDGLFSELERLSEANKVGFRFLKEAPQAVGCSGEEYELLCGFSPKNLEAIMQIAKKTKTKVTVVAEAVKGGFLNPCKSWHFY